MSAPSPASITPPTAFAPTVMVSVPPAPRIPPVRSAPAKFTLNRSVPVPPARFSTLWKPLATLGVAPSDCSSTPLLVDVTLKMFPSSSPTIWSAPAPPSIAPVRFPVLAKSKMSSPAPPVRDSTLLKVDVVGFPKFGATPADSSSNTTCPPFV